LPTGVIRDRANDPHAMLGLTRQQIVGIGVATVDQMLGGQQPFGGQRRVNGGQHRIVLDGGGRRHHVGDQVGAVTVARLGVMPFVADPRNAAFAAVPRFQIVGVVDELTRGRDIRITPPARRRVWPIVLLDPDLAQDLHGAFVPHLVWRTGRVHGREEGNAIRTDLGCAGLALGVVFGQAAVFGPQFIALQPALLDARPKPVRIYNGQSVEGLPHRLDHQFQPVNRADGGEDLRGVGALLTAGLEEATLLQESQQGIEQLWLDTASDQAEPEFAQHRSIEARIGQLEGQGVLPVDPAAHRVGSLAVGEPFELLHDQNEC